jgi:heme/copper-type cytochrome/quinol oxidase subunit 2
MKNLTEDDDLQFYRNRQFFAFYLVLISIVGCIVALVALFLSKHKKSFINLYYIHDPPFLLHAILETALTHLPSVSRKR